jgi:vacuolar protein sorting-associated protein 45
VRICACLIFHTGDLGVAIKGMVDDFQSASKSNQNIQSIADMQRFIENYPEFRAKSGNVSKHVTLMGEMGRIIDERHLLQVSQVEQASAQTAPRLIVF